MEELKLRPNEEDFEVRPIGVRYICEFCHEGEMIVDHTEGQFIETVLTNPPLIQHKCTKCGGTMRLPRSYPYIEWVPVDNKKKGVEEK